jgi:hypothetical protein
MRLAKNGFALSFDENNTVWHNDDSYVQMGNLCLKKDVVIKSGTVLIPSCLSAEFEESLRDIQND